jgi:hypothetical protein
MNVYCTYFDHHYLTRGLTMFKSLRRWQPDCELWVLCLSPECLAALKAMAVPGLTLVTLDEFEAGDADLQASKLNRSTVEYYFTCSPSILLYVLTRCPEAESITYLDADLFFFGNPAPLHETARRASVSIIPHRFAPRLRYLEEYGRYNVGWLTFQRDANALACLQWWRERCIEWCYDRLEPGRFADQKYLDEWPQRFQGVQELSQKGANLAPWNLANYGIGASNRALTVDGEPLIFYHFHRLRPLLGGLFQTGLATYGSPPARARRRIYGPYLGALKQTVREVAPYLPASALERGIRVTGPSGAAPGRALRFLRGLLQGDYVLQVGGLTL